MQRTTQLPIFITVVIMAVITAVGLFLAWSYISSRDEPPESTYRTVVEGVEIEVQRDPSQIVRLVVPAPDQPEVQPDTQVTEPAPVAPTPTTAPVPPTATPPPPPPAPTVTPIPPPSIITIDYVVQPNDTLYSISTRPDTSITLMAQEGISQDDIIPGQTIKLPVGNPAFCPGRRPYAVAEGDTAFSISRRVNVSLADLKAINNLDDNFSIKAAQILCVP